jgi:hypothetical protein
MQTVFTSQVTFKPEYDACNMSKYNVTCTDCIDDLSANSYYIFFYDGLVFYSVDFVYMVVYIFSSIVYSLWLLLVHVLYYAMSLSPNGLV